MMENTNIQSKSNNKNNTIAIIVIIIFIFLFLLIGIGGYFIIKNVFLKEEGIIFNTNSFEKVDEDTYNLNEKIDSISGKNSFKEKIEKATITIKSGNYEIYKKEIENSENWKLDDVSLAIGNNELCVEVILYNGDKNNKCLYINNYSKENLGSIDDGDDDNDNLKNYEELILGTMVNNFDSDNDGLSDYDEIYITFTNPNEKDTDSNGILDSDEDFDNDTLNNLEEVLNESSPHKVDTDDDGLSDYDEINKYKTSPSNEDTDGDGVNDYVEIFELKTDANKKETQVNINKVSEDKVASVEFENFDLKEYSGLSIEKDIDINLGKNIPGYILDAYNLNSSEKNLDGKILFDISNIKIDEINPTIYEYEKETQNLNELDTVIENNKAVAKINSASTYVLIDKNIHDSNSNLSGEKLESLTFNNLDVVFVIDISQSMDKNDPNDSRKQIMSNFISTLDEKDRVGVVLFKKTATVLNGKFAKSNLEKKKLITDVFNISNDNAENPDSGTNGTEGLNTAIEMFGNTLDAKRYIIFLTDGEDTFNSYTYERMYEKANEKKITILTIGLGSNIDSDILKEVAENTDGTYYQVEDSDDLYGKYSLILDETNDYRVDSNNDGISDYFTKMICEGKLKTSTGINPFEGVSYEKIQKSSDYDKDGVLNGDEVKVTIFGDKVYLKYISDPLKVDTDGDGLNDKLDKSPLTKFDSDFRVVNNLSYTPSTPTIDKFEKKSDESYNTVEKNDYKGIVNRANTMVLSFGKMPAAVALKHFLNNKGTLLDFNNDWGLLNTYRGKERLAKNVNKLITVAEGSVKNKSTITFASNKEFSGTDFSRKLEDMADIGWWYAVGYTSATMVGQVTNNNGNYEMILYYNIVDYYDWEEKQTYFNGGFGFLVSDAEMYRLHTYGVARQYRINLSYKMKIKWKEGDRYYLSKFKLWEMPKSMSLQKIN